jgi:fimbrial chaperone protein
LNAGVGSRSSFALFALGALCAASVDAATLTISPVGVTIEPGQTSATLEIKNADVQPITVQVRIYSWTQVANEDVLASTSDIIMSPPIATIAAGSSQTLRLLLRPVAKAGPERERHYRVLLDEIPTAAAPRDNLTFAMRSSIPVIVLLQRPSAPGLKWAADRDQKGSVVVTATNAASVYDRIFDLTATLDDGSVRNGVLRGTNAYVLPHSQRQWVLPGDLGAGPIRLNITTRNGKTERILPIGP